MIIKDLVSKMSLEEKCSLLSGKGFWWTKGIPRLSIPKIMMSDGPHGLRKQEEQVGNEQIDKSSKSVCYPTASCSANSFDVELLFTLGESIGEEAQAEGVSIVLGPGVNIKRLPICGRNFEYFSEDPHLSGELGAYFVKGLRSKKVFASLKHFAVNNQERYRMRTDAIVDERAMREIYLSQFERVIKEDPGTVMCCYNSVNGDFGSRNTHLLRDILRDEWSFDKVIMTDWGAIEDRRDCLVAGLDLEMPDSQGQRDKEIEKAVLSGELDEKCLDEACERLISLIKECEKNMTGEKVDRDACHERAKKVAESGMVLLKNEGSVLPINKEEKILLVGEFAKIPRIQGAGSSMINPYKVDDLYSEMKKAKIDFDYVKGYDLSGAENEDELIKIAQEKAKNGYDKIILLCGLPNEYESEGYDREHINLPPLHIKLAKALTATCEKVIVAVTAGGVVDLDFLKDAKGILLTFLAGEASGSALFDILFGKANPSGRLAETYPTSLDCVPSTKNYPGNGSVVEYRESIFVGYRYFDTANVPVQYPFGYGLSYTEFEYSNPKITDDKISVDIQNIGEMDGAEVVQVYVGKRKSDAFRAKKELKGFEKIFLKKGETKTVEIRLDETAFRIFDTKKNAFVTESGEYEIYIAKNVNDVAYTLKTEKAGEKLGGISKELAPKYFDPTQIATVTREEFEAVMGRKIIEKPSRPFTMNSTIEELSVTFIGRIIKKMSLKFALKEMNTDNKAVIKMQTMGVLEMPMRAVSALAGGAFTLKQSEGLVDMCNGKIFRGLKKFLRKA